MSTQKIKKSDLKIIYNSICESWQNKLKDIILWSEGNYVELEESLILQGYKEANADQKQLIEKYFKIVIAKPITERVKTFDDVLNIAGLTIEEVIPYKNPKNKKQKSLNAFAKLQLIEEVLNEGWKPIWEDRSQYKYYPYFGYKAQGSWCLGDFGSFSYFSITVPAYFKTSELALFAGKIFLDIYKV